MRAAQLKLRLPPLASRRLFAAVALFAAALAGLASCKGACDRLVARYCECDTRFPENVRGCEMARDKDKRAAAAAKAKARGKELEQICREKLDNFDCPDRAAPEFYPGGFSFTE